MSSRSSRKLILVLAVGAALIVGVYVATVVAEYGMGRDHVFGLSELFHVDGERNVPAYYSLGLLAIASILLAIIAVRQKPGQKPRALLWAGLSLVFLYLAADEGLQIHETIGKATAGIVDVGRLTYYAWVLPYAVLALVFGASYWRFLGQLSRDVRKQFIIAGILYVGGAMGTEVLAGIYVYFQHTEDSLAYAMLTGLEETLEMTGIIWFIYALLLQMQKNSAPMHEHRGAVLAD